MASGGGTARTWLPQAHGANRTSSVAHSFRASPTANPAGFRKRGKTNHRVAEGRDAPLPPPWPTTDFEALSRRQSIVAWTVGTLAGTAVAVAAIAAVAVELL